MATCPNCKAELMEVNGRYICSECGKEVSGAEINVGTWGDPAQEAALLADPEPGAQSVSDQSAQPVENEDYIEGEGPGQMVSVPGAAEPENVETPAEQTDSIPVADTVVPEQAEDGFYTKNDVQPDVNEAAETSVADENTLPEAPAEKPAQAAAEVNPADPMYNLPGEQAAEAMPTVEDFYEEPLKAEVKSPVAGGGPALPQDEGIYRDPISEDADQPGAETPNDPIIPPGNNPEVKPASERTLNKRVLLGGIAFAVVLLVGGVIAYVLLNAKSNVDNNSGGATATETNCDNAGSDTAKTTCIAQAFTACDVAKWSGSYPGTASDQTRKVDYEIQGPTDDNQCQVDETFVADTVNADTIGKTMSCLYDSTTTIDKAISTNSVDTCSGELADTLFGVTGGTPTDDTSN